MEPISTNLRYPFIEVRFTVPFNNGLDIDSYQVVVYSHVNSVYEENIYVCDGSDSMTIASQGCDISMTDFLNTFGYARGQYPLIKVRAHNDDGWGEYSPPNSSGVLVQTEPTYMVPPEESTLTNDVQIVVTWPEILTDEETGASELTSYSLEWDQGTGNWIALTGYSSDSLDRTATVSSGLTAGYPYRFRTRAKNVHGWGPYST